MGREIKRGHTEIVTSSDRVCTCSTQENPPVMMLLASRMDRSALNAVTALTGFFVEVKT
jgi:hypothetical protein